jgi:hypothetical protein
MSTPSASSTLAPSGVRSSPDAPCVGWKVPCIPDTDPGVRWWCGPSTKRASLLRMRNKASARRVYGYVGACVRDEPRDASAMHARFGGVGNSAANASLDTPQRDVLRASSGGNHHEAASDGSCVSRLPRNGRGFWIRGGERRYESRRERRVEQLNQFLRRWLLSTARRIAPYVAGPSARSAVR